MCIRDRFEPVNAAALQPDVEHYKRWSATPDRIERLITVARCTDLMAVVFQDSRDEVADIGFVIDDENVSHYGTPALCSALCSSGSSPRFGRTNRTIAPGLGPGASSNSIRPPWSSTTRATIARPNPVPFARVVTYGSIRRWRSFSGKPKPLSITSNCTPYS